MAIAKSNIIKKLKKNFPNILRKDLEKLTNVIIEEIKQALKRNERVELRRFGVFFTKIQKARISRNPRTQQKVYTQEKRKILFKMAKDLSKKINNNEKL